jgi:hypothetical protein
MTISDGPGPNHQTRLETEVQRLSSDLAELTAAWDAAEEVDTNLGSDVENLGRRLALLLDHLRTHSAADTVPGGEPLCYLRELEEAIHYYAELDEHDTGASIDIFDRLAPGIALAQYALTVPAGATTTCRVTVGELIERLRAFPSHLEVWIADPRSPDGYVALDGTAHRGSDAARRPETPRPSLAWAPNDDHPHRAVLRRNR